jgi:hypothetical protein
MKLFGVDGQMGTRTLEKFREAFEQRLKPQFFAAFDNRAQTVTELRARWPHAEKEILKRADRIGAGIFDLVGLTDLFFGRPIDWHFEPVAGKRSPLVHWSQIDFLDTDIAGDKKIIWELNRHQYFVCLGQAYWLTGDEKYARIFVTHLEEWMEQNPLKLGINWASSLEIAFRCISWLWALHYFRASATLSAVTLLRVLKFLYIKARHLETYLSTYFSPNTHLTGEALGLFYLGTLLPEFDEARRWKTIGRQILLEQLDHHIKPDGVYFEQSSYYHRYTADFYLHFVILSTRNQEEVPNAVCDKLKGLLRHLMLIMRPDGTTPFYGDDDGGRLVMLDRSACNDFRGTLSTGAVVFNDQNLKFNAGEAAEETLWLLGTQGLQKFDSLKPEEPNELSVAFPCGGYYVMRDGWSPAANYLRFDAGPHGFKNCGHAHADLLSFELSAGRKAWLIDPGTFTYTGSKKDRNWFRSSLAHNTLTVDRESSSQPNGPFSWISTANPEVTSWFQHSRFEYVEANHDGYMRLIDPVRHSRGILFLKHDYWIIRDVTRSKRKHTFDIWFHFNPSVHPQLMAGESAMPEVVARDGDSALKIVAFTPNGAWRPEQGWVSECYGIKVPGAVYAFSAVGEGVKNFVTFLLPSAAKCEGMLVRQVNTERGQGFEVRSGHVLDVFMLSAGGAAVTGVLASDFECTWARFSSGNTTPDEIVLVNGKNVQLDGDYLMKSENTVRYAFLRKIDDRFEIESAT